MKFKLIKLKRDRVEKKLSKFFSKEDVNLIVNIFDEYEKDNVETIKKLRRKKQVTLNKINGALKQTLNEHPVITRNLIGSASKRIYGSLLEPKRENIFKKVLRWIWK